MTARKVYVRHRIGELKARVHMAAVFFFWNGSGPLRGTIVLLYTDYEMAVGTRARTHCCQARPHACREIGVRVRRPRKIHNTKYLSQVANQRGKGRSADGHRLRLPGSKRLVGTHVALRTILGYPRGFTTHISAFFACPIYISPSCVACGAGDAHVGAADAERHPVGVDTRPFADYFHTAQSIVQSKCGVSWRSYNKNASAAATTQPISAPAG